MQQELPDVLDPRELSLIDRYWRAANYLSVGQIYLMDNPLLRQPLKPEHVKPRLLGHWGTTPGLNFIYAHLNRCIKARDLDMIYVCGPGHGGPGMVANTYLEGSYSDIYPAISRDETGMRKLFRQFSFPGGIPSHAAPETPGSIHEGGELGYALVHAYGAAFDNPELTVACVVGDGEAETGPLAASWHSNKFLNPVHDGAVLPILHLNGYKIANPTVMGRMPDSELKSLFEGYGYEPLFVEGNDPQRMHQLMAAALNKAFDRISAIQLGARTAGKASKRPKWPMIILRSPKGWTGPKEVDGKKVEGFWRSHQVPIANARNDSNHRQLLENWMRSYAPENLFDASGRLVEDLQALAPSGDRRMGANPHANGGGAHRKLDLPDFRAHAVPVPEHGTVTGEATRVLGGYLRDVMERSAGSRNFRLFGPDETASNRLDAVFDVTGRVWMETIEAFDENLATDGRVMEVLSEHLCQGWLEGYTLTGRHGLFSCYEAFIHIVDSMFNQHAKWLKVINELPWRKDVPSLNYLLTSHVWRQDHNGFSHQDPGFVDLVTNKKAEIVRVYFPPDANTLLWVADHCLLVGYKDPGFVDLVTNKKAEIVRVYFPPDANTLLWVADHCLKTHNRVNVIVAGKQPSPQWLGVEDAIKHCEAGAGIWDWAGSNADYGEPDVVMACAGDVPTLETLAAVDLLRQCLPQLRVRVVNVVDLMTLQPQDRHPHGLTDAAFDALFTTTQPVIFAYHGYPYLIHRLTYSRRNHANIHVRGFNEEGTTTTPFDMVVLNELDRYHLAIEALKRLRGQPPRGAEQAIEHFRSKLDEHARYIRIHGEDIPEIREWSWPYPSAAATGD